MDDSYRFAELSDDALRNVRELESKLSNELGEEISIIAYAKNDRPDAQACRADLDGE